MDSREIYLLRGLVSEYIRTARPVGSQALGVRLQLSLSPATIRAILHDLEDQGYIYQPHTSAGRVPTDRGYREYVNQELASVPLEEAPLADVADQFEQMQQAYQQTARASVKLLSKLTQAMAVGGFLDRGDIQEAGLPEVLDQPEGDNTATVRELSAVLRDVDRYLEELFTRQPHGTQVYIGQENPLYHSQHISMIVRTHQAADGTKIVLAVVGPKRMEYQRNVRLLNSLVHLIHNI